MFSVKMHYERVLTTAETRCRH